MKRHEIDQILTSDDYGVSDTKGVSGVLARLYRQTLKDCKVSPTRFKILLTEAAIKARKSINNGTVSKYFTVGNLRREIEKPVMTFKVFMKGIKLLKVTKMELCIKLTHASGVITIHSTNIDLGDSEINDSIFDEDISDGYSKSD
jgi:hypothetical protein